MKAIGIIDLQNDFMLSTGSLYVPGAEKIRPVIQNNIIEISNKYLHDTFVFCTMDLHDGTESEMIQNGGKFPLHCMKDTFGQKLISELEYPKFIVEGMNIFEKSCYDVFDKTNGNPYLEKTLKALNVDSIALCGVVGNICVEACALGLRKMGISVILIEDSIVWMDIDDTNNEKISREKLIKSGCKFIPTLPKR
jgi:nicotinamidase/pyrazinamidase